MTTNIDLERMAAEKNIKLDYIIYKDEIFKLPYSDNAVIINMSNSTESGTHWVSIRCYNNEIIYFDPFGIEPPTDIINYAIEHNIPKIVYNDYIVEDIHGINCGQLSLLFLRMLK